MNKPPAFQFYPKDFLQGVSSFSQSEVGAYILLLCHQWENGSVPDDPVRQRRIAFGKVSRATLAKFIKHPSGGLVQPRLEKIRREQEQYRKKQAEKGELSGIYRQTEAALRPNSGSTEAQPDGQPEGNSASSSAITTFGSMFRRFVVDWCSEYEKCFKIKYQFTGARDGASVKRLLEMKLKPETLLAIAKSAWTKQDVWSCKQALTIHGFQNYFNEINVEVNNGKTNQRSVKSGSSNRNADTLNDGKASQYRGVGRVV